MCGMERGGRLYHPKYFKIGKNMASSRKDAFEDFFWPTFCFCNYERIFSLSGLNFSESLYFYMGNKRGYKKA